MKMKLLSCLTISTCLMFASGCVSTEDGHRVAGMPFIKDRFVSRYARPVGQVVSCTRTVLDRNGRILLDNSVNNTFEARVNQHRVWVKVADVDGKVTEVIVQARGPVGGDADTAAEISKQIGMLLVAGGQ